MRVFLRQDETHAYRSVNFAVAADGFYNLGWELIGYQHVMSILPDVQRDDIVVDFGDQCCHVLRALGVPTPELPTYPEPLQSFLGRRIWTSTINTIAAHPERWPVFVKPRDELKKFTGVLVRRPHDLIGCGDPATDTPVWCSEPVVFRREWRCFVRYGQIVDVRPYKGDWRVMYDPRVIETAITVWEDQPRGWALDVGVDTHGRTLVVEANDGFALGAYGLAPRAYAQLLSARWTELTGTVDACNF